MNIVDAVAVDAVVDVVSVVAVQDVVDSLDVQDTADVVDKRKTLSRYISYLEFFYFFNIKFKLYFKSMDIVKVIFN